MRIKCQDVADFITNLGSAKSIHRQTIYFNRSRRGIGDNPNPTSFEVYYQLSAVLVFGDEEDVLLEAGEVCGVDRMTADGETLGADRQIALHDKMVASCKFLDLKLLPGILDL